MSNFTCNANIYENSSLINKSDIYSPAFLLKNTTGDFSFSEKLIKFYIDDEDHTTIKYHDCDTGTEVADEIKNFILNNRTFVYKIILKTT
jgi:hypothetical protein